MIEDVKIFFIMQLVVHAFLLDEVRRFAADSSLVAFAKEFM